MKCAIERAPRARGFTLVELVVTLALASLLLRLAVPNFRKAVTTSQLQNQMYTFAGALNQARSEAVARGGPVLVCASSDGTTCGASATWSQGWLVFVDSNANGTLDSGEPVLRVGAAMPSPLVMSGSAATLAHAVTFRSDGTAAATGSFVVCLGSALNPSRALFINLTGQIWLAPDQDSDGVPENPNGSDITTCTP